MKHLKTTGILLVLLLLLLSNAYAQQYTGALSIVGIELDELNYAPPPPALLVNLDLASLGDLCDGAAPSYLAPSAQVYPIEVIGAGQWTSTTQLTEMQYAGYSQQLNAAYLNNGRTLHASPNGFNGPSLYAEGFLIGSEYVCVKVDEAVAVYWNLTFNGMNAWILESLRWTDYVLNPAWIPSADGDTIQADAPRLSDLTIYYWGPKKGPDVSVGLGGTTIKNDTHPAQQHCQGGALSSIQSGDMVEVYLTGFTEWPWDGGITEFAHNSQNLLWLVGEWMGRRPLSGLNDKGEPDLWTPITADHLSVHTTGTVTGGPLCSLIGAEYLEPQEMGVVATLTVYTWWRVAFEISGQIVEGWYPESAVRSYDRNVPFDFTDTYYLLRPLQAMQAPQTGRGIQNPSAIPFACEGLPAALSIPTAYTMDRMNVRNMPAGAITNALGQGSPVLLQPQNVCLGGYRWRLTDAGWLAESSGLGYLLTANPPRVEPTSVPTEEPRPTERVEPAPTATPERSIPAPRPTQCDATGNCR